MNHKKLIKRMVDCIERRRREIKVAVSQSAYIERLPDTMRKRALKCKAEDDELIEALELLNKLQSMEDPFNIKQLRLF